MLARRTSWRIYVAMLARPWVNPSRQRLQRGAAAKFSELAAACAAQARRLRGFGVQGMNALHRIEKQRTQKVSAAAARLIVQVWSCRKLDQRADADNSRKLAKRGKANWLTVPAQAARDNAMTRKPAETLTSVRRAALGRAM